MFQTQILPVLGVKLDLFLFVTLYYGFLYGASAGTGIGIVTGLLQDVFSYGTLGIAPIGLVTCGLLAGYIKKTLLLRYRFVRIILVFILTILNLLIYAVCAKMFLQKDIFSEFAGNWFKIAGLNTVFAGIVFWLTDRNE